MPMPVLQEYKKGANKAKTPPGKKAKAVPAALDANLPMNRMGMLKKKPRSMTSQKVSKV
jgi:hypothetical protein